MQLHTHFISRQELANYLQMHFPNPASRGAQISPIRGGRSIAETLLQHIQPSHYAATRNMLSGAVTRLSPYLKQGVVTLAEVRRVLLELGPEQKTQKLL